MYEILAKLGETIMKRNPVLQLGSDIMQGNASQGFSNFMDKQFAPQMQFGRTMMDPNATGEQQIDAALGMTGNPVIQAMRRPEEQGQGLRPRQIIQQGQPNYGLLSQMML